MSKKLNRRKTDMKFVDTVPTSKMMDTQFTYQFLERMNELPLSVPAP